MRIYEKITETVTVEKVAEIVCNRCSRHWKHFEFSGSEFEHCAHPTGAETTYKFALCDDCIHTLMDSFAIAPDEEDWIE